MRRALIFFQRIMEECEGKTMDLELSMHEWSGYEPVSDLIVTREESLETAIPEYCPDLTRIVDSVGQIRIREKEQRDGSIHLAGVIRVMVLYTSEESAGLRSLSLTVPFSCSVEDQRQCAFLWADSRLLLLEVKMLGARKLYIRVLPEFRVRGYRRVTQQIASGAEGKNLQLRRGSVQLHTLAALWEREFPFAQELSPKAGQSAPEDLLMDKTFLRVTELQPFGNKLVVKGEATLSLLYRSEGQSLCSREETLPFSQILEIPDLPEDAEFYGESSIIEQEIHPVRTEDGIGFSVTMRIGVLIRAYVEQQVEYVSDLYSTSADLIAVRKDVSLPVALPDLQIQCAANEPLEGGTFFYLTDADLSAPELRSDEYGTSVTADMRLRILYLDPSGAPVTAERSAQITTAAKRRVTAGHVCALPETMSRSGAGCELRVPVQFSLQPAEELTITAVTAVQQQGEIDRAKLPSLVLRRLEEGETLWDAAKRCRTEESAIMAANGLTAEPSAGVLLLIPKTR